MARSTIPPVWIVGCAIFVTATTVHGDVTADSKDAWLILYNVAGVDTDSNGTPDSKEWKNWFVSTHGITDANTLGVSCTTSEWIKTQAELEATITDPVKAYLDTNSNAERIIGILLGYNLPGIWGTEQDGLDAISDPDVPNGHHGGRSIASTLEDFRTGPGFGVGESKTSPTVENARASTAIERICDLPIAQGRLTRPTMTADTYMTARIDGPTLDAAKRLTRRALAFSRGEVTYGFNDALWFDYDDAQLGNWFFLQEALEKFGFLHWIEYTLDQPTDNPTNDIVRFGWHMNKTWANTDNPPKTFGGLCESPFGPRLLAAHNISYGGTTLRCRRCDERPRVSGTDNPNYMSTTGTTYAQFAVNALWPDCNGDGVIEDDGFASVIVATGEPGSQNLLLPEVIVPLLDRGWTGAESFFASRVRYHWVFTYVGDPFLTSPRFPRDCNENDVSDSADLSAGTSLDVNTNAVPDECEPDCNENTVADSCDLVAATSNDCEGDDVPDECQPDCNANSVSDVCDIAGATSEDCDTDGLPDECEADCNTNGIPDDCDIVAETSFDCNGDGVPDECEADCNSNGIADDCDLVGGTSCDCNFNATPDECDVSAGTSPDLNTNAVPDDCEDPFVTFVRILRRHGEVGDFYIEAAMDWPATTDPRRTNAADPFKVEVGFSRPIDPVVWEDIIDDDGLLLLMWDCDALDWIYFPVDQGGEALLDEDGRSALFNNFRLNGNPAYERPPDDQTYIITLHPDIAGVNAGVLQGHRSALINLYSGDVNGDGTRDDTDRALICEKFCTTGTCNGSGVCSSTSDSIATTQDTAHLDTYLYTLFGIEFGGVIQGSDVAAVGTGTTTADCD